MQGLSLLLAVIISRAVASPIAQTTNLDGPFDIAQSSFDDAGIATPGSFQIAGSDTPPQAPSDAPSEIPSETPSEAPRKVAQPGDPVFQRQPQPKPKIPIQTPGENNPAEEPKNINQPFDCGPGKSGACCVGVTRDGITHGCIRCTSWIWIEPFREVDRIIIIITQKNRFHYWKSYLFSWLLSWLFFFQK